MRRFTRLKPGAVPLAREVNGKHQGRSERLEAQETTSSHGRRMTTECSLRNGEHIEMSIPRHSLIGQ